MAQISSATADPAAGTIDRDASRQSHWRAQGRVGHAAGDELIPPITLEQMRQGILHIQEVLHSEGMTAVKDPDIQQIHWDAYKSLLDEGRLKERICVLWYAGSTVESARKALAEINSVPRLPATLGGDRLLSCGVKMFMDGSGGARTGWVYDDWLRNGTTPDVTSSGAGNRGLSAESIPRSIGRWCASSIQNGVPVGTHAVGDRAMDWVVDTYALVEQEHPRPALRHSIIHANLPTAHALDVMASLQKKYDAGYPEMQAEFLWWIGDIYAGNYGPKRGQSLEPFKTLLRTGDSLVGRVGLLCDAACSSIWPLGCGSASDCEGHLRDEPVWDGGGDRHPYGVAQLHCVGLAADVSGKEDWVA